MSTKLNPSDQFKVRTDYAENIHIRTVGDFWQWAFSDLGQNITRGILAEYLVAWAIGKDDSPRDPWKSYDLETAKGKRIEVKFAADVQDWTYANRPPKFIIKKTSAYDKHKGYEKEKKYQADIYVLAHLMGDDRDTINPLDTDQWEFWIFTQEEIISILKGKQSISVSQLKKIKAPTKFHELTQINDV